MDMHELIRREREWMSPQANEIRVWNSSIPQFWLNFLIEYDVIRLEIWLTINPADGKGVIFIFQLDLERPLEEQGPFQLVLHKFTDKFGRAEEGDPDAINDLQKLEVHSTFIFKK